jgi:hypothetical protein
MLSIKLVFGGRSVSTMKAIRVELEQAIRQHNELFMRFAAFLNFEHLLVDDLLQPYLNRVVFYHEKVFDKLF